MDFKSALRDAQRALKIQKVALRAVALVKFINTGTRKCYCGRTISENKQQCRACAEANQ